MKKILIISGVLISCAILFISIARANLEIVLKEEKEDRIRVVPVDIYTEKENGERIKSTYYLPKIKILPANILYPIKIWRDKLWLWMTSDKCKKSTLLMIIADKQMAEDDSLSSVEAVNNLIQAYNLCPSNRTQIGQSAQAYRQITSKMRKYSQANERIEKFINFEMEPTN